jgi:transposase-like protein
MLITETVTCPYCGEAQSIEIDPSGGRQQAYEEDCQVCCRPWDVRVRIEGDEARVRLSAADEVDTDF